MTIPRPEVNHFFLTKHIVLEYHDSESTQSWLSIRIFHLYLLGSMGTDVSKQYIEISFLAVCSNYTHIICDLLLKVAT